MTCLLQRHIFRIICDTNFP